MFRYFKSRKQHPLTEAVTDKVAGKVHHWVYGLKTGFARLMSRQEQKLNISQKKWALVIFCVVMSSMSSWWLYQGIFMTPTNDPAYLKKNSIVQPENSALPDSLNIPLLEEYRLRQQKPSLHADSITQ